MIRMILDCLFGFLGEMRGSKWMSSLSSLSYAHFFRVFVVCVIRHQTASKGFIGCSKGVLVFKLIIFGALDPGIHVYV